MRPGLALALVGATLLAVGALVIARAPPDRSGPPPAAPEIGGPFSLTDGAGHHVTSADFAGDWRLVYFGYTHCPDVCPTTLSALGAALDRLPQAARQHVRVLFVTVDPARDTPALMGSYVKAFGPEFVGLTGTPAELAPVEASFRVYAARHDLPGGDYAMDHSSIVYVMRPDGGFAGLLDESLAPVEMARRLIGFGV